jgi:hypothetical protein
MSNVAIYTPETSDDDVSRLLVDLTECICKHTGDETGYGLGGRFGYGENFENDVFMMHRFCWCERADCPWCRDCECEYDSDAERVVKQCDNCKNSEPRAPNFLHKPSGAEVRWYKWIGRSMEVSDGDWPKIIAECIASLAVKLDKVTP